MARDQTVILNNLEGMIFLNAEYVLIMTSCLTYSENVRKKIHGKMEEEAYKKLTKRLIKRHERE